MCGDSFLLKCDEFFWLKVWWQFLVKSVVNAQGTKGDFFERKTKQKTIMVIHIFIEKLGESNGH